nr:hypothetical protein [Paenibacillus xylanexedens]
MKLKQITYLLILMIIMTGCSKESNLIYTAPTNEQIVGYISENELATLDTIWVEGSAIILMKNSLITLYSDQHGKLHDHNLSWGSNNQDVITIGDGVPYIAIIIPNDLLDKGSKSITLKYSDGTVDVEGQEHDPIEVAILAAFLFYRYKFLSQAKDKNLYRLPYWTRT